MVGDGKGETASGRSARRFLNSAESPLMALSPLNPCFLRKSQILSRRPLRSEISKIMSGRSWFLRCMTVVCEWPASTHIHCLNPLQPYLTRLDRSNSPYQTNWWDDIADIGWLINSALTLPCLQRRCGRAFAHGIFLPRRPFPRGCAGSPQ